MYLHNGQKVESKVGLPGFANHKFARSMESSCLDQYARLLVEIMQNRKG